MPLGKRRDGLAKGLERMLETGFANRVLPFDSGAARVARRRTAADGSADHTSRLSNRGHCPLTRYGGGMLQRKTRRACSIHYNQFRWTYDALIEVWNKTHTA